MNTPPISGFQGENRFLSNFWPCVVPVKLPDSDLSFCTVEHAYVAAKTLDPAHRKRISNLVTPGDAKRYGRELPLRPDWEEVKLGIMEDLVRQKFFNNPELEEKLLDTGNAELIEANHWNDTFWGVCKGKGQNHLGKILMTIRSELLVRYIKNMNIVVQGIDHTKDPFTIALKHMVQRFRIPEENVRACFKGLGILAGEDTVAWVMGKPEL